MTDRTSNVVNRDLGTALVLLRVVAGLTQEELAQASGIRASSISDYERGKIVPELNTLRKLLTAQGYPLAAVEQALTFIEILRTERSFDSNSEKAFFSANPPAARLFEDSAAVRQEIEKVAAEAANVVGRMVRLMLVGVCPRTGNTGSGPGRDETPSGEGKKAERGEKAA